MANFFQDIIDKYKGKKLTTKVSDLPMSLNADKTTSVAELPYSLKDNFFQDVVDKHRIEPSITKNISSLGELGKKAFSAVETRLQETPIGSLGKYLTKQPLTTKEQEEVMQLAQSDLTSTLQRVGMQTLQKTTPTILSKLDDMFAKKPKTQQIKERIVETGKDIATQWSDRFAPIKRLVSKAEVISNKKILPDDNPYVASRLFAGVGGKIDNALDNLGSIIKNSKIDKPNLSKFLTLQRMVERGERGFSNPLELTANEAKKGLNELKQIVGENNWKTLHQTANKLYEYGNELLDYSRKAEIIDDKTFDIIKSKNQKWTPFDVVDYLENQMSSIPSGSKSFSVGVQDAVKKMIGTTKEIADPLESLVRRTYKVINLAERNKVAKKIVDLRKLTPELNELIKPIKYGGTELNVIPKGYDKISVFEAGTKVDYAVPQEIAESIKGLTQQSVDFVNKFFSYSAKAFRAGTTILNASFFIPNALRDYHTAKVMSKYGFNFVDYLKGFSQTISRGNMYKLWKESGGTFATRMAVYSGYPAEKALKNITEGTAKKAIKTIFNPFKLLNTIASVVEEAPRVAVFQKAFKKGAQISEAALESRQATIDFAKMGSKMRVANSFIPYLNARLQGTLNIARILKEKPIRAIPTIAYTVSIPTILSYLHNRKQEGWEKIPQWEKDNNWIITTGTFKNSDGEIVPSYIKIPKGDIGRVFGNPLESLLTFIDTKDSKSIDRLALEMFSDISPVPFYEEGKMQVGKSLSSITPPLPKTIFETKTNKELFTGLPIVPESRVKASPKYQFKASTTETAKIIGEALNISPAKLQYGLKGILGSVTSQALQGADVVLRKIGKAEPSKLTTKEKLMYAPITGRFFGARGGEEDKEKLEKLDDLEREATDRRIEADIKAQKFLDEIKKTPKEERATLIKDTLLNMNEYEVEKVKNLLKDQVKDIEHLDSKAKALPVKERTKYILDEIKKTPKEERATLIKQMIEKGILTDNILKEMQRYW
jgi:hypothetical protein